MPADTQQRPGKEFSSRTWFGGVRGENSSSGRLTPPANTGSFDSAARVTNDSIRSAQDDKWKVAAAYLKQMLGAAPHPPFRKEHLAPRLKPFLFSGQWHG